jgi:membrane protease YdiL (CAAX protease family)
MLLSLSFFYLLGPVILAMLNLVLTDKTSIALALIKANICHLCLALGILFCLSNLLNCTLSQAITDAGHFRWNLFLQGFVSLFLIFVVYLAISLQAYTSSYSPPDGQWTARLLLLPLLLLLTPIQVGAEEITYRLFPLRFLFGRLWGTAKQKAAASFVLAFLFMAIHLHNHEVTTSTNLPLTLGYYLIFGFAATYITLDTGGLEAAFGMHLANNLYTTTICNYVGSTLPSLPLFLKATDMVSVTDLAVLAVAMLLVYVLCHRTTRRKSAMVDSRKGEQ